MDSLLVGNVACGEKIGLWMAQLAAAYDNSSVCTIMVFLLLSIIHS
jgi:hypothetical protein